MSVKDGKQVPDPGFGYRATYKDRNTGGDVAYMKLYLRPEILNNLNTNKNGLFELSAFPITGEKKSERTPDVVLKPTIKKAQGNAGNTQRNAHSSQGKTEPDFPF